MMDQSKESSLYRDPVQESGDLIQDADLNEHHVPSKPRYKRKLRQDRIISLAALVLVVLVLLSFGGVFDGEEAAPNGPPSKGNFNASAKPAVMPTNVPAATRPNPAPKPTLNSRSTQNPRIPPGVRRVHPGPLPKKRPAPKPKEQPLDLAALTSKIKPLIVTIEVAEPQGLESGCGFFLGKAGLIATRYQTIQKAAKANAILSDGSKVEIAGAVFTDPARDMAVLKVESLEVEAVPLSPYSNKLSKGKEVAGFYIDSDGQLQALRGTINELTRINAAQIIDVQYQGDIDPNVKSELSPNLRGGPLLNSAGEVVGMMVDFDEDGSIQALSGFDLQSSFPFAAEEVLSLSELSQDRELAEHGLNIYMMNDELNISIPDEMLQELEQLVSQESQPLSHYAEKRGTRLVDRQLEWNAQPYLNYLEVGSRKPAWDEAAASLLKPRLGPHPDEQELIEKILKTDCDDPVALMQCASSIKSSEEALELADKAAGLIDSSAYPRPMKFKLRLNHFHILMRKSKDWKLRVEPARLLEQSLMHALREPNLSAHNRRMLMDYFYGLHTQRIFSTPFRNPKALVAGEEIDSWVREMLMAFYHRRIAWEARGTGLANAVPQQNWDIFHAHLKVAGFHFLKAWKLQPDHPEPLTELINIAMASRGVVGESPRFWFERAVETEFDHVPAYDYYLESLEPRWGGRLSLMLAFGQECLETRRFDTQVPMQYHAALGSALGTAGRIQLIAQEPSIVENYRKLFEGYASATEDPYARSVAKSQLACVLILANRQEEAKKLRHELGPDLLQKGFDTFGVNREALLKRLDE